MIESKILSPPRNEISGNPVLIANTVDRIRYFPGGITMYLCPPDDKEALLWLQGIEIEKKFTVPSLRSKEAELFFKLQEAVFRRDRAVIDAILPEMRRLNLKSWEKMSEQEKWAFMSVQLPEDWGFVGKDRARMKRAITGMARGKVLEAMCGFTSYFGKSAKISEVVALDYCKEGLERYDYPERARILYDLERVTKGEKMDFFQDSSFQTIGVFFGMDYLHDPSAIYKEFHRILSPGGKLLICGGTTIGYRDLLERSFDPEYHSSLMRSNSFSTDIKRLSVSNAGSGKYYLVTGTK